MVQFKQVADILTSSFPPKRLNKYISDSGFCSRRHADKLIEQRRVTINDNVPELGTKVVPGDVVKVNGHAITASASNKTERVYIAYNKPIGITCTTEKKVRGNIIDAIDHKERIFPIGRLDKPSEGLIFLTSDGDIVNKILRAENAHDKEYIVTVDKPISERFIERMSRGVPILGTITKPCIVRVESRFVFTIILTQGLNRQIRRMCEYLDYDVRKLKRSRIMKVELGDLKPGQWRNLTTVEMTEINQAVQGSSKTAIDTAQPKSATDVAIDNGLPTSEVELTDKKSKPSIYQYTPAKKSDDNNNDVEQENKKDCWPFNSRKPAK
ncbi:23S rRNA pseudouridine(2604) synthase RluF [Colwellia psychrerythraea]|uniref:Pseudouridine synthase n=1 Tax=Colwellia psychrerythraea TaxID=28229 RepID=A0A099KED1_COLPS|nr:23S rRNA pseudouridine(2604) synthase RluF [Colwellia psychrerythraea]KGJ87973.1 pseudouridine synthase Rsu [Colwellia psychrerythraea]